jgi:hypothetical protein
MIIDRTTGAPFTSISLPPIVGWGYRETRGGRRTAAARPPEIVGPTVNVVDIPRP